MNVLQIVFWTGVGVIVLAYAGYPLAVWLLAAAFPRPVSKAPVTGSVSFIVAAHNEAGHIARRVENLLAQKNVEIAQVIVGSDGSTDQTESIVAGIPDARVKLVALPERRGKPAVLNACVAAATGDYLVFCDARQTFTDEATSHLLANFADESVKCVSGELVIRPRADGSLDAGLYWRYEKFIRRSESRLYSTIGASGAICAVRREDFVELAEDILLDDVAIPLHAQRAGGRTVFEPEAVAWDEPISSDREWSRKVRTLAGNFQLLFAPRRTANPFIRATCLQFLGHKVSRLLVPGALLMVLVGTFGFSGGLFWTLLGFELAGVASAVAGWTIERAGRPVGLLGAPLTLVMLNLAVVAGFWGWLTGTQDILWKRRQETG